MIFTVCPERFTFFREECFIKIILNRVLADMLLQE